MRTATRVLGAASALALAAGVSAAQANAQNDLPANNSGDVVYIYSSPSIGFSALAFPPDINGDLYWRAHGPNILNDVENDYIAFVGTGSIMEVDGYVESIFDTDWSTSADIYARAHTLAVPDSGGLGGLEPDFLSLGTMTGVTVLVGSSGFGNPCTVAPSLCVPAGGTCPPAGFVNGWGYSLELLPDPASGLSPGDLGSGILVDANGATSTMATTWFVPGGMTAVGGVCGSGDYSLNDVHSTNETQADVTGNGINPEGGLQLGGAFGQEAVSSMAEGFETFHGNIIQWVANTGTGLGVEQCNVLGVGLVGGAMNGRRLAVSSGAATAGASLIDHNGMTGGSVAIAGASLTALPNPGVPVLGGHLLVLPDGLFNSTSGVWQAIGPVGSMTTIQLNIPPAAAGATLHLQGANFDLASFTADTTNATRLTLSL